MKTKGRRQSKNIIDNPSVTRQAYERIKSHFTVAAPEVLDLLMGVHNNQARALGLTVDPETMAESTISQVRKKQNLSRRAAGIRGNSGYQTAKKGWFDPSTDPNPDFPVPTNSKKRNGRFK